MQRDFEICDSCLNTFQHFEWIAFLKAAKTTFSLSCDIIASKSKQELNFMLQ